MLRVTRNHRCLVKCSLKCLDWHTDDSVDVVLSRLMIQQVWRNHRFHRRSRVKRFEMVADPRDRGEPPRCTGLAGTITTTDLSSRGTSRGSSPLNNLPEWFRCTVDLGRPGGSIGYEFWFTRHRRRRGQVRDIARRMIATLSTLSSGPGLTHRAVP